MMEPNKIDLKAGRLFPMHFQFFGGLLVAVSIGLLLSYPLWAIVTLLVSLLIFTASAGIEFSPKDKTYRPYNSFLFIKTGKNITYDEIEKVFINRSKVSQRIYTAHTAQSATFKNEEFDAYIKFTNGKKEYLLSDKKKDRLIEKLKIATEHLKIEITDNTAL